jgi:hypothetical protein
MLKLAGYGASAAILTPIMSQLAAQAAGADPKKLPKRVVFCVQSNGMNPNHLLPSGITRPKNGRPTNEKTEEASLKDRTLHAAIEGFAPFKDRLALVQGLSGRIAISDHSTNVGCLGACPANKGAVNQTIDSAMADALPGIFPHVALGMGADERTIMNYRISAAGPGKAIPIVCSPELAFKSLFGSVSEGEGRTVFDQKTNLLEFMADDVKRARNDLVGEEKQKFDQYLQAFESLHGRQKELLAKADDLKKNAPKLGEKLTAAVSSSILESQYEIGAAALIAGMTNCLTLTSGGGGQEFGKFPEFNIPDLHGIGHGAANGRASSEDCFVELRQFHVKLIAGLAKKLEAVKEGDGTMLDNTLIVYLSDSGEGHHPSLYEWPVILLGNLVGKLKTNGRYLQLPHYGSKHHRTLASLYCTLLHAAGKPRDKFGANDPGIKEADQSGVIAELLA